MNTWPHFAQDEIDAVVAVLKSGKVNYWTGQECREFEKEFAAYVGVPYAIAMANGTLTLEAALRVLGVGPGDEVITTPRTFLASASCIVMCGATPIFADIDRSSQNITAETIAQKITPRTKAIIAVHLAGWPCEMDKIMDLAKKHNLFVIEDCAQAHGAIYKGKQVGSWGHIGSFSFCQDKIMTLGGEGGMVTTSDESLWKKMWSLKDHGKDFDVVYKKEHPPGFRWLHETFGTNWRLTEMQAAIGRKQLQKLPGWLKKRTLLANILHEGLEKIHGLRVVRPLVNIEHAYYKYYVFIRPEMLKPDWSRDRIMKALNDQNIPCFSGSCSEIYLEKCFETTGLRPKERLPIAKELGETSLLFLIHPTLERDNMDIVVHAIQDVMRLACNS
jgi:dTDP-4-amino-4,6-dideoxygalactose transaminase